MKKVVYIFVFVFVFVTSSCSKDDNESAYATMTSEFCTLQASADKSCLKVTTDKDQTLSFDSPLTVSWATTPDSTYRALLYYNKVENTTTVTPLSAYRVSVLRPSTPDQAKKWSNQHDPLGVDAVWRSTNNKWLNIRLAIKTGTSTTDATAKHSLGLVCDSISTTPSGRLLYYSLCHSQNNIPAYYTVTSFVSIPIENATDSISLNVTTWNGKTQFNY